MLKIKEEIGDLYETDPTAVWRSVEDIQRKYDIMTYVRSSQMSETSHLLEWCFPANTNRFDFCSAFVHVEEDDKVSRISTSSKQEFSVTVCQEDKRNFWEHDPSKSKYDYAFVRLYIAKIVGKILDVE